MRTRRPALLVPLLLLLAPLAGLAADWYVDAVAGSDQTGDGSAAAPWKSLTHALARAPAGDVWIAPGVYDAANGERFPLRPLSSFGVSLHGAPGGGARIATGGLPALFLCGFENNGEWLAERLEIDGHGPGGRARGTGIETCGFAITLRHNRVVGFETAVTGGGVHCGQPGCAHDVALVLDGNDLIGNGLALDFGSFALESTWPVLATAVLVNNVVSTNDAGLRFAGGCGQCAGLELSVSVANNTIACVGGDGVELESQGAYVRACIQNNVIGDTRGFGVDDPEPTVAAIARNEFLQNDLGPWRLGSGARDNVFFPEPGFIDPSSGDYRLRPDSPLVDAGEDPGAPPADHDESPRPLDGDGDGAAVSDIGAFEAPGVASRLALWRAELPLPVAAGEVAPAFPVAGNPDALRLLEGFTCGQADPDAAVLARPSLAFYTLDGEPRRALRAAVDATGHVRFYLR